MTKRHSSHRFPEMDILRGIAVIMMIAYHLAFDLSVFFNYDLLAFSSDFWRYEGIFAGSLFIFLTGMISALLYRQFGNQVPVQKMLKRAGRIFIYALGITAVTFFFDASHTIFFGILHFLSVGIFLSIFLLHFRLLNIFLAGIVVWLGTVIKNTAVEHPFFLPLGIPPASFASFDYYPLIPWLGIMLLGLYLGHIIYEIPVRRWNHPQTIFGKSLSFMGKHSLVIYLLHQPILIGLLSLIFVFDS